MTTIRPLLALVLLAAVSPARAGTPAAKPAPRSAALQTLTTRYLDGLFRAKPHLGSYMGDHRFDGKLPDLSPAAVARRVAELKRQSARLTKLRAGLTALDDRIDADIMADGIALELLYLTEIREPERDPRLHDSFPVYDPRELVAERLGDLMHGTYAPAPVRARAVVALLHHLPTLVKQYQRALKHPAKIFTETAIRENRGRITLLKTEVAEFLRTQAAPKSRAAAARTLAAAVKALEGYQTFLEQDLLPRSTGDWRLGAARYDKKFPVALATRLTPDQAVKRAQASFARSRQELYALAQKLHRQMFPAMKLPGPHATPAQQAAVINRVRDEIGKDHPTAAGLVASHAAGIDRMRAFIEKHNLLKLPPKDSLTVTVTPLFKRGVTAAEYLAPNLLDEKATFHGTYYVDPPDPSWSKAKTESYLRFNNTAQNELTAIHEAYPGHHVQTWYAKQHPNRLRLTLWNAAMVEGWAVYGEEVMVRLGWGGAKNDRYRFLTLRGHLVVAANTILDVKLQRGQMSDAEAVRFMVEDGFQEKAQAEKKLIRAKLDSTQLCQYFLGWNEIKELERDYRAQVGKAYTQGAFDAAIIGHGSIGVRYLREYLLGTEPRPRPAPGHAAP
jgi:uncharacterized protein (DUF885 family)